MRKVATAVAKYVPASFKVALLGPGSSPRRFANAVHALLNRLPGERYPVLNCSGPLQGYRMRVDWNKHRSFAYGTWEPEIVAAIMNYVRSGMTAIDIGAHGGFFSLLLAKIVGPSGHVVAFEPLPANFRILKENVALNSIQNTTIEMLAVCDHSGEFELEVPGAETQSLAGPLEPGEECRMMRTRCTSLDSYFDGTKMQVDFIKMDVEGAEDSVLEGSLDILNRCHPTMMVELHNVVDRAQHPVTLRLQNLGYAIDNVGEASFTAHILAKWSNHRQNTRSR